MKHFTIILFAFFVSLNAIAQQSKDNVPKKPLFELFTSSTCGPCAYANPVIDNVLSNNTGNYSLIKYQMDWPGNGDPYFIEANATRRYYYGVSGVPDLYINSEELSTASSLSQEIFDTYAGETTQMEISVSASIDNSDVVSITASFNSLGDYEAGMIAHVAVLEKVTTENTAGNGETSFHNVVHAMLPDGEGTELGAFTTGTDEVLEFSVDMSQTNMEQPNDLLVVVFVQKADMEIVQSEMVEVEHSYNDYSVSFVINDSNGNLVENAELFLDSYGTLYSNASGELSFDGVLPGTYDYSVICAGLFPSSGTIEVSNANVTEEVTLEAPDFFFYEDFENGIPDTWTAIYESPDMVYGAGGAVLFFKQSQGENIIMFNSPEIDLSACSQLKFEVGSAYGEASLIIGTVSDPEDPATFVAIESVTPGATMEEYTFDLTGAEIAGPYLSFSFDGDFFQYFSFDNVKLIEAVEGYNVSVVVVDNLGNAIEGAVVQLGDSEQVTNAQGTSMFLNVVSGEYNCVIECENAQTIEQTVTVDADMSIEETMTFEYEVKFVVTDNEGDLMEGAVVEFNGQSEQTNSEGVVTFVNTDVGEYSYTVSDENAESVTASILVNEDVTITIALNYTALLDATEEAILLYPNPATSEIHISGNEFEHYIILNVEGKMMMQGNLGQNNTIDVSSLINGVYLIKLNNTDYTKTMRFSIVN